MVDAAKPWSGPAPARAKPKASRLWWSVHQWVGLKLSILLSFIFLTGTLAVFSHEIDWALRPALRVDAATVSGPVNWGAVAAGVAQAHPEAQITTMEAPMYRSFAVVTTIRRPDDSLAFVYAHPTTGRVQGDGHWVGAKRILRNMHRHLMMPVKIGAPIVSSLSILMLVSLGTSFVVYKKWWRGFFKPIRWADARTAWGDVHRLAGVWSLWFVALIAVTGVWYLVESLGGKAPNLPRTKVPAAEMSLQAVAGRLPASLAAAQGANPELRIQRIIFPTEKVGAFQFQGQDEAILVRERANTVWTRVEDAQVALVTDGRELDVHQRISEMADPLHFGTFGGLATKLIWFGFGAALTGLSVSGMAIYGLRLANAERRKGLRASALARAWAGMGRWRWLAIALVIAGFVLLPSVFAVGGD